MLDIMVKHWQKSAPLSEWLTWWKLLSWDNRCEKESKSAHGSSWSCIQYRWGKSLYRDRIALDDRYVVCSAFALS